MIKNYRKELTAIGGYENSLVSIPASSAQEMIRDIEALELTLVRLVARSKPFAYEGLVDELCATVPLIDALDRAILAAEELIK